jgi:hypothetical protein
MSPVEIVTYFVLTAIMVAGGCGLGFYALKRREPLSPVRVRSSPRANEASRNAPRSGR